MKLGGSGGVRAIRSALGVAALMMAAAAGLVQQAAPAIGLDASSANAAAFGMLLGAVAYATALWQWR